MRESFQEMASRLLGADVTRGCVEAVCSVPVIASGAGEGQVAARNLGRGLQSALVRGLQKRTFE